MDFLGETAVLTSHTGQDSDMHQKSEINWAVQSLSGPPFLGSGGRIRARPHCAWDLDAMVHWFTGSQHHSIIIQLWCCFPIENAKCGLQHYLNLPDFPLLEADWAIIVSSLLNCPPHQQFPCTLTTGDMEFPYPYPWCKSTQSSVTHYEDKVLLLSWNHACRCITAVWT